jgi:hypothetical protein
MIKFLRDKAGAIFGNNKSIGPKESESEPRQDEVRFHPSSYADPHGRVLFIGERIFRGVPAAGVAFCARLFEAGIVDCLVDKQLLVKTQRSAEKVSGYSLVIEHERVPHVSYPFEWPGEMLRAAALHTLDLLDELATRGLTLKDAHGWNILFRGCRPVFVDFGSIIELPPGSVWYPHVEKEFRDYFLHALELIAAGHGRVARAFMRDFDRGIRFEDAQPLLSPVGVALPAPDQPLPFSWYRERIAGLNLQAASLGWSGYYDGEFPPLTPDPSWTPKHHAVHEVLTRFRPKTVLDIGANRGWYAMLAAKEGACAVAYDNDEACVSQLYADAKGVGMNVQPLVMSCLNPTPRYGIGDGLMESATERLQSDLVLGLALVHHMVFKMHLGFAQIADGLAAYTKKVLVVELPPATDIHVSGWMTERYEWYTQENFTRELRRHFSTIEVMASHPAPRILLVCKR